jgi:hypothetical protein
MLSEHSRHTTRASSKTSPDASKAKIPLKPVLRTRAPRTAFLSANLKYRGGSSPRLVTISSLISCRISSAMDLRQSSLKNEP